MKQKKLVYIFLILSLSLTLFLPALNVYFGYKTQKINLHNLPKRQFFSTDNLESIINYTVYKTFNFSLNEQQVVVGKDKFFFLGNGYSNIIDKAKGTFIYQNQQIDLWTSKLKNLQNWYESQGIEFIVVIASNKHTVYNDKLPDTIAYDENHTFTDAIIKSALNKKIHIINLKKYLREKKRDKQLYFYSDTHWNHYGALIGYTYSMKYLNAVYHKNYKMAQYHEIKLLSNKGGGDLTNFLKINYFLEQNHEKDYQIIFDKKSDICYGKITKSNTLKECTSGIKNTFNQYSINSNAANKEKLLYLCDSFGLANSELYEKTFSTVWRFHLAYTQGSHIKKFIKKYKPNLVIYQIVERDIGNNYIVGDIPYLDK